MWKLKGLIKKEVKFPGVIKKKSCRISMSFGIWSSNFQGMKHNFAKFLGVKPCFVQSLQG